jgi:hypothetical protein
LAELPDIPGCPLKGHQKTGQEQRRAKNNLYNSGVGGILEKLVAVKDHLRLPIRELYRVIGDPVIIGRLL